MPVTPTRGRFVANHRPRNDSVSSGLLNNVSPAPSRSVSPRTGPPSPNRPRFAANHRPSDSASSNSSEDRAGGFTTFTTYAPVPTRAGPPMANLQPGNGHVRVLGSISEKFALTASPHTWGTPIYSNTAEPDDELHDPDSKRESRSCCWAIFTVRGLVNLGTVILVALAILGLFAVYPIIYRVVTVVQTNQSGFNLGGINASGQIPEIAGNFGVIDRDTPREAYFKRSLETGEELELVFSDEFNTDGRTFYPGDDPYWEAVDLWYWGTNNLEWYDPSQVYTKDGAMHIKLEKVDDPSTNHNQSYKGGMVSTWNKFCFSGGLIEAAVRLPGDPSKGGLWPALWTLGNLGRAGYGATLEGLWPYSYDSCDVGTLPNQTYPDKQTPIDALRNGDKYNNGLLSFLPGQRLSACTCPGESHPGPMRKDGTYVGRAAPEIDIFEAQVDKGKGQISQSAQWAPFNAAYKWTQNSDTYKFYDNPEMETKFNPYEGGAYQQAVSGVAYTNQSCYELTGRCYAVYGFEYKPGFDDAYLTWINNDKRSWTIYGRGLEGDRLTEIGPRSISQEPMYIIANLGISPGFGVISEDLVFPTTMSIDWIRVYQHPRKKQISCDPKEFPTAQYIETYKEAYSNPEITTWTEQFQQPWPKNSMSASGCD